MYYESILKAIEKQIYKQAGKEFHIQSESEYKRIESKIRTPAELIELRQAYYAMLQAERLHRLKNK